MELNYPQDERDQLREMFKQGNKAMLLMWKLGLGRFINIAPKKLGQIMVLVHTGRKSGKQRYTPLNYAVIEENIYCLSGFGAQSQWYKNVLAKPEVELWLPNGWWSGTVEEASTDEHRLDILRAVLVASGFAASTFEGIQVDEMSDVDLATLMTEKDYRLLKIQLVERRNGRGGPGEFAWLWFLPLALFAMVLGVIRRKK